MITLNTQPHTEGFRVLTLGHTRKIIPPQWYKAEGVVDYPWIFDKLQHLEKIWPSVENLWSPRQDGIFSVFYE